MRVISHTGIVGDVIMAINDGAANGLNTVQAIELTRAEMDEFLKHSPFDANIGKNYGSQDIPPIMHVEQNTKGNVREFYLNGVLIFCKED